MVVCDNEWIYLVCALFNKNYYIKNDKNISARKFKIIIENVDLLFQNDKKKNHKSQAICDICGETNHLIKCSQVLLIHVIN